MKIMHLGAAQDRHPPDVRSLIPQTVENRLLDVLLHARHPKQHTLESASPRNPTWTEPAPVHLTEDLGDV